jgi:hypothetical protein
MLLLFVAMMQMMVLFTLLLFKLSIRPPCEPNEC